MQAVVHHLRHFLGSETSPSCEIGTAYIADEQRVSSQYLLRLVTCVRVPNENANTLRRVAWRLKKRKLGLANLKLIAVFNRMMRKLRVSFSSKDNGGAGAF